MTAFLSLIFSNTTILALLGGLIAVVAAYMKGKVNGAAKADAKNAKKELDAYEQSLKDLAAANRAGAAVRPDDGGMLNDPNNRDAKQGRVSGLG